MTKKKTSKSSNRIVGISASPRKCFTSFYVSTFLEIAKDKYGLETTFIDLSDFQINSCDGCGACSKGELPKLCKHKDDWFDIVSQLYDPEPLALVIGAPVYIFNPCSLLFSFFERFTVFHQWHYHPERFGGKKPPNWAQTATAVIAVGGSRNGGQEETLSSIIRCLLLTGFVVVGGYPRSSIGVSIYEPIDSLSCTDDRALTLIGTVVSNVVRVGRALQEGKRYLEPDLTYKNTKRIANSVKSKNLKTLEKNLKKYL